MSVLTSPLTVIWFALLGPLIAVVGAAIALVPRVDEARERIVVTAGALAAGTFVGPAIYLGLSLLG